MDTIEARKGQKITLYNTFHRTSADLIALCDSDDYMTDLELSDIGTPKSDLEKRLKKQIKRARLKLCNSMGCTCWTMTTVKGGK